MLFQRFEDAAAAHPDLIAIDCGELRLTYRRLHDLVVRQSARLATLNLPNSQPIGLIATREASTYVSYLAILRLGHAVVPLGPDNPVAFQELVLRKAGLRALVLAEQAFPDLADAATQAGVPIVSPDLIESDEHDVPAAEVEPGDVAYILFTSGSTGQPKGVPITHGNVAAYLDYAIARYQVGPGSRLSHTFALTFDPSVFDLFASWTTGATLVVPRGMELLAPASYARSRQLTHWFCVPSLLAYARRMGNLRPGAMPDLQWSKFIGEPLPADLAAAWQEAAPNSIVENVYGPTEVTVACVDYRLPADTATWPDAGNGTVPIGQVYPHLECLVVDDELWLRGPQRFDGYLDPGDNAGRFGRYDGSIATVLEAGEEVTDADWYRTGDRVRRTEHGMVHIGRMDRQVKVRGYRIELGDIEATLRAHTSVSDAAVLAVPDVHGGLTLVAVVVGDADQAAPLKEHMKNSLPIYMVPECHWLPALPLNRSGKVDYVALTELFGS